MPLLGFTIPGASPAQQAVSELGVSLLTSGLLTLFRSRYTGTATWQLAPEDDLLSLAGLTLEGDGEPESFRVVRTTNIVTSSGFQVFEPATTPVSREPDAWDIVHLYAAEDRTQDLRIVERVLVAYQSVARELRRQPLLRLRYADTNERVWLASVETDYPHGMFSGSDVPVALRVSMRLVRANIRSLRERPKRPRETTYRVLRAGETFEDVALEFYGDPEMGVALRRINADILEEYPGARIKILDRDHPRVQESTAPSAPCFIERRAELVNAAVARKASRGSPSWDALEAEAVVAAGSRSLYDAEV